MRTSKEKVKFAKFAEHNFTTEIFRIVKVIDRIPRPVYELEDLDGTQIDGQFHQEELTPYAFPTGQLTRWTYWTRKIDKAFENMSSAVEVTFGILIRG